MTIIPPRMGATGIGEGGALPELTIPLLLLPAGLLLVDLLFDIPLLLLLFLGLFEAGGG